MCRPAGCRLAPASVRARGTGVGEGGDLDLAAELGRGESSDDAPEHLVVAKNCCLMHAHDGHRRRPGGSAGDGRAASVGWSSRRAATRRRTRSQAPARRRRRCACRSRPHRRCSSPRLPPQSGGVRLQRPQQEAGVARTIVPVGSRVMIWVTSRQASAGGPPSGEVERLREPAPQCQVAPGRWRTSPQAAHRAEYRLLGNGKAQLTSVRDKHVLLTHLRMYLTRNHQCPATAS